MAPRVSGAISEAMDLKLARIGGHLLSMVAKSLAILKVVEGDRRITLIGRTSRMTTTLKTILNKILAVNKAVKCKEDGTKVATTRDKASTPTCPTTAWDQHRRWHLFRKASRDTSRI